MTSLPPPILVAPILRRACLESNRNPLLESHLCSLRTGSLFVPWKQVSGTGEGEAVFVLGSWYPSPPPPCQAIARALATSPPQPGSVWPGTSLLATGWGILLNWCEWIGQK